MNTTRFLHFNKFESQSPQNALYQVWFKLALCLWRRFLNVFKLFLLLPPLGKWRDPSFEQTWIPTTQQCFVQSLVEIGPVVLEKAKNVKSLWRRQTTDKFRSEMLNEYSTIAQLNPPSIWICRSSKVAIPGLKTGIWLSYDFKQCCDYHKIWTCLKQLN